MFGKLMVAVVAVATAAILFIYLKDPYSPGHSQTEPATSPVGSGSREGNSLSRTETLQSSDDVDNPFSTGEAPDGDSSLASNVEQVDEESEINSANPAPSAESTSSATAGFSANTEIAGVSIYDLGRTNWESDAQFEAMQQQLEADPALLQALLAEVKTETDPERLKRLTQLIGRLDKTRVTEAAQEMLYSGNPEAQLAALDMLRQTQGDNSTARDLLVDVIGSEQDPRVLNVALNAFSTPGAVSGEQRQGIIDNVTHLATHYDANVRARSYSLLATYSDTAAMTPVILQGLSDPDPNVRGNVAHSLLGYNYPDESVRDELIRVAENTNEKRSTRQASLQALSRMSLNEAQRERLRLADEDIRRAPSR